MIGPYIAAVGAIVFVVGMFVVTWEWSVSSNPDAPHGGPIIGFALLALLLGGVVSCSETTKAVMEMKKSALSGEGQP